MTRHAIIIATALLLAACGSGEGAGNNASDEGPAAAVIEQTPDNLQDDPTNSVVPLGNGADPVAAATPVAAIPAAFRGRWGIGVNDCDPKRDDTKGLMTVSTDTLRFWESRATLRTARLETPTTLVADLAFTGEGQEWQQKAARLVLQDDGKTLVRDDAEGGTVRYGRCPEGAA